MACWGAIMSCCEYGPSCDNGSWAAWGEAWWWFSETADEGGVIGCRELALVETFSHSSVLEAEMSNVSWFVWTSLELTEAQSLPWETGEFWDKIVGIKIHYRLSTNSYIINILSYTVLRWWHKLWEAIIEVRGSWSARIVSYVIYEHLAWFIVILRYGMSMIKQIQQLWAQVV